MDYDLYLTELEDELYKLHKKLREVGSSLTIISERMLDTDINAANAVGFIRDIAYFEGYNSGLRNEVIQIHDVLHNLIKSCVLTGGQVHIANMLLGDCEQLDDNTEFYSDRINFLMSNVMGFVNIKQNKIIQVFSVASVALLPPTLVASVYGMNLAFPEFALLGSLAYPYVVALMVLSALVPMAIFWRKGWLN